jgi:hypothetical protein
MQKIRFTEEHIIAVLKAAEAVRRLLADLCAMQSGVPS